MVAIKYKGFPDYISDLYIDGQYKDCLSSICSQQDIRGKCTVNIEFHNLADVERTGERQKFTVKMYRNERELRDTPLREIAFEGYITDVSKEWESEDSSSTSVRVSMDTNSFITTRIDP